jgi:hypothetical protein
MSQIILETSNREDLALLLSFAKRLNIHVVSAVLMDANDSKSPVDNRRDMLKRAAKDPLFLADIAEITDDFKHSDAELL